MQPGVTAPDGAVNEWEVSGGGWLQPLPNQKPGSVGDAGVITCRTSEKADRLNAYANTDGKLGISEEPGINSRLDPLQAAILRVKLPWLESHNSHRQAIAEVYRKQLAGQASVQLPAGRDKHAEPVYHQFVVQLPAPQRDAVRARLADLGVGTLLHYPQAAHQMPAYEGSRSIQPDHRHRLAAAHPVAADVHLNLDQAAQVAEYLAQAIEDTR